MHPTTKHALTYTAAAITATLIAATLLIAAHEQTHAYLYKEAGCTDIQIGVLDNNAIAYTTAKCNLTPSQLQTLKTRQATVEAVGYQLIPATLLLFMAILIRFDIHTYNNIQQSYKQHPIHKTSDSQP